MKQWINEFKRFALRGNVLDMAVGVIIGGAFSTIVKSLTDDILMPLLGILIGQVNLSGLAFTVKNPLGGADVTLAYGLFLQNVLNFILIALAVFLMVKAINQVQRKTEEKEAALPKPGKEELLLAEIRDILKEQKP
ncbi:large-conductance mechanosensitive channel [Lachnospiraceae bacterium]|nr:large-conductance mechanosensitive channel [Lachnospiraceae bacterium]